MNYPLESDVRHGLESAEGKPYTRRDLNTAIPTRATKRGDVRGLNY